MVLARYHSEIISDHLTENYFVPIDAPNACGTEGTPAPPGPPPAPAPPNPCPDKVDGWWGDNYCDDFMNTAGCDYDGGDCCQDNPAEGWDNYCQVCAILYNMGYFIST